MSIVFDERGIVSIKWDSIYYVIGVKSRHLPSSHRYTSTQRSTSMPFPKFGKKSGQSSQLPSSQSLPPPDSKSDIAWSGLLSTLPIVQQSLGGVPVPGLQVAVGGLLQILQGLDVRES